MLGNIASQQDHKKELPRAQLLPGQDHDVDEALERVLTA